MSVPGARLLAFVALAAAAACLHRIAPPPPPIRGAPIPVAVAPVRRAPAAGPTGKGVTIYVFDGGVMPTHPQLSPRVRMGFDAFQQGICNPHGTAVAGAAASNVLGVAPDADIVDVRIINCTYGRGSLQAIVDATAWTIADHAAHPGPAVVSWAFIADTGARVVELDSAADRLRAAGMLVVTAAGNFEMDACRISPANAFSVLTVGETRVMLSPERWAEPRVRGTAWGACVDVFAPGYNLVLPAFDADGKPVSLVWQGTSMSVGIVAGFAASLLERHPAATPQEIALEIKARTRGGILPLLPLTTDSSS